MVTLDHSMNKRVVEHIFLVSMKFSIYIYTTHKLNYKIVATAIK